MTTVHIDPLTTECVLRYMGLAIDEIKLIRSIEGIARQIKYAGANDLASGRRRYLLTEFRFLNKRLQSIRKKVKTH
ncbi:MAG: hypothetical protein ACI9LO_000361 [Planctomycetota bacterium]|jgi:hypothetical protein